MSKASSRVTGVVLQGGAMRSIYCAGAVQALLERWPGSTADAIFASSAGCVSGLGLYVSRGDAGKFKEYTATLLNSISGDQFINRRRVRKVVDVEFLVDSMLSAANITGGWPTTLGRTFEVALTTHLGTPSYFDVAKASSLDEVREAFIATMAIPLLYPLAAHVRGVRYWDGGIADPLPLVRALEASNASAFVCISNVPPGRIGRPASTAERNMLRLLGRAVPQGVKAQMIAHNALGASTERIMGGTVFTNAQIASVFPSEPKVLGGRLDTEPEHLFRLQQLGYEDASQALATVTPQDE